jgi:hypothetical protein
MPVRAPESKENYFLINNIGIILNIPKFHKFTVTIMSIHRSEIELEIILYMWILRNWFLLLCSQCIAGLR